jgi:hypothetical protein
MCWFRHIQHILYVSLLLPNCLEKSGIYRMNNSDLIDLVALRISEEAVPDEVDLAPVMAQAFVEGGREREELFKREQGSLVGGFGPGGLMTLFPWILKALVKNAPFIYELLTTDVADLVSLLNDTMDLKEKFASSQKINALPDDPYQSLKIVMNTVSTELQVSGLSEDHSDLITYRVIRALIANPKESTAFIEILERGKP